MSRPNLEGRQPRSIDTGIGGAVGSMFPPLAAETPEMPKTPVNTADGKKLKTARRSVKALVPDDAREKTSFALLPDLKLKLSTLKLELRRSGVRTTEAEIVEALIRQTDASKLRRLLEVT